MCSRLRRRHGGVTAPIDGVRVSGAVSVAEISGSESVVHFDLHGLGWVSQSHGVHRFAVGETADFRLDVARGLYFDADGRCVSAGGHGWRGVAMARIGLKNLRHSYREHPAADADWAVKRLDVEWAEGSANALLGPSGCGKTTLLNIISGLLRPTEGAVFFGDRDVTAAPPDARNIAQVFQFPVVYDTMSVFDNLAFPLRNRGVPAAQVDKRVREIAALLDLEPMLMQRAAGLTADGKQKISLGRGLVRDDVNVIMFDEPLTVIDPHLKWRLRGKLKELHQRLRPTMIYVTHDQTEALTFADQVLVMNEGTVVQSGTPVELFERPRHTFVGHFIGSPGMNVLPATFDDGVARFAGHAVEIAAPPKAPPDGRELEIGVRPEFVRFADSGIAVRILKVADSGRYRIVDTVETRHRATATIIKLLVAEGHAAAVGARISEIRSGVHAVVCRRLDRRAESPDEHQDRQSESLVAGRCRSSCWSRSTRSSR